MIIKLRKNIINKIAKLKEVVFRPRYILSVILLLATIFCFYGLNWGLPDVWAVDEGGMVSTAIRMLDQKTLNPNRLMYPSFTYYLLAIIFSPYYLYLKFSGSIAGMDFNDILNNSELAYNFYLLARTVSALAGVATVYLIYKIAKELYNIKIAFLAGFIGAIFPPLFYHAHWAKSDIFMIVLMMWAYYLFIKAYKTKKLKIFYLACLVGGVSISAKYNSALLILFPYIFVLFNLIGIKFTEVKRIFSILASKKFWNSAAILICSFLIVSPYVIINIKKFVVTIMYQFAVHDGGFLGFNRPTGFVENPQIILSMIGYAWFTLLIASLIWILLDNYKKPRPFELVVLVAVFVYYLYLGSWHFNQPYYLAPIFPLLVLFMSRFVYGLWTKSVLVKVIVLFLAIYVFIFSAVAVGAYTIDNKIKVKDYIKNQIDSGSKIEFSYWPAGTALENDYDMYVLWPDFRSISGWDDFKRKRIFSLLRSWYYSISGLNVPTEIIEENYGNRDEFSMTALVKRNPDYIILSSSYEIYFKYPEAYPQITNYYRELLSHSDYEMVKYFAGRRFGPPFTMDKIIILKKLND